MTEKHTILAIDPGSKCGWALWRSDMPNPVYGTWLFEWGNDGERLLGLQKKMMRQDRDFGGLTQVVIEHNPGAASSERAKVLGYGFFASAAMYCAARRIPFRDLTTDGGWRIEFVGRQNKLLIQRRERQLAKQEGRKANTRDKLKMAVLERCEQLGWSPQSDNEGDALGILDSYLRDRKIQTPWHAAEVLQPMIEAVR
ncbi:MAG: hypothetical protein AAFY81_07810 [Pseudomonadota bacterium]